MAQHFWVELKMTPIEVEQRPDGTIDVHVTEGAESLAEEDVKDGCWFCFTPLESDTLHTECLYDPRAGGAVSGMGNFGTEA